MTLAIEAGKINFSKMSVTELIQAQQELTRHLQDLEQLMTRKVKRNGHISPLKGTKVKPKYRGPKGQTWAGRGARPVWLRELLKTKGNKLEKYRVKNA